jgi:alkaline phosphatase D
MLGHVGPREARIWAKASRQAKLSVRVGQQEDLAGARTVKAPLLKADTGFMGNAVIGGLAPAQRYFYCVLLDGKPAMSRPFPSFVTAPPEGAAGHVRAAFISCVGDFGYEAAPGYADLCTRTNFDVLLLLGDNHYANTNDLARQSAFYADQRRQPGWGALTARVPTYAIWDDHDYGPDNSDGALPGKEKSLQAFLEHWTNPAAGEPDNPGIYCKLTRGEIDFFLLDVRYHRSPNKATNLAAKTMLGEKQLAWLKRELRASRARIKVLASGSEWQSQGTEDSWRSFREERDGLFQFIEDKGVKGVVLISGDRHFTAAYHIGGRWVEITSGPIGSKTIQTRNLPEMFLKHDQGKLYCVLDFDTTPSPPTVTLEVYRVAQGLVERRALSWDELHGAAKIAPLPATPTRNESRR